MGKGGREGGDEGGTEGGKEGARKGGSWSWICFLVQTKMSWRGLLIIWYSRPRLGIKVQSCAVLRWSHK